jgi:hypothetical protein
VAQVQELARELVLVRGPALVQEQGLVPVLELEPVLVRGPASSFL